MNINKIKLILDDSILKEYNFNKNLNYNSNRMCISKFLEKYPYFHRYEVLYLLKNKHNLENLHIFCKMCGKKNNWSKSSGLYHIYCSVKCKSLDPDIKEKTSIANKKVAKRALQKRRKTNQLRHGDPNYHNAEQMRITKLNDLDENGKNSFQRAIEKGRQTNLIRIGVENPFSSKDPEINGKAAIQRRYNHVSYTQTEEYKIDMKNRRDEINEHRKNTVNLKHKVDYYFQTEEFKNRFKNLMLERFDAPCYTQSQDYQNKKALIKQKEYETKRRNGTLGRSRSKAEIRCYELLKTKLTDIEHSYRDNVRYPFNCDIYVPSLDLFIECHFSQYHHYKPFDKNCIGDLVELSKLKTELNNQYLTKKQKDEIKSIIKTWTERDILKLKTFQDNNLNYKIFYTEKEFNEWFQTL